MRANIQQWMKLALLSSALGGCAPSLSAYQQGLGALERGDDEAARQHFESALSDPADASRAQSQLEDLEMAGAQGLERERPLDAIAIYQGLIERNPDAHRARMRLGKVLVQVDRVDEASQVLQANPACTACSAQLSSMLAKRGRERLRANEWDLARADLERAVAIEPTADVYLDIAQLFTLGANGSSAQASAAMVAAYPLLGGDAKRQERWAVIREDIVRACIRSGDFEGADEALQPEDPRVQESDDERARTRLMLQLDVADALKSAGKIELTMKRVEPIWESAQKLGLANDPGIRTRVLDLYAKGVAAALGVGDQTQAAARLQAGRAIEPAHPVLRLQAAIMVVGLDAARAQQALDEISQRDANWNKAQALIFVQQAFVAMEAGDRARAEKLLEQAESANAEALEVRLAHAQLYTDTPVPGLSRRDLKRLSSKGKVNYADKPVQYARASAELRWVEERWKRPAAKRESLRLPGFSARLESLRQRLAGLYPFPVSLRDEEAPQLVVENKSGKVATVDVVGPGVDEAVELDPEAEYVYEFEDAGVAQIVGPDGEFFLVVEAYTAIEFNP